MKKPIGKAFKLGIKFGEKRKAKKVIGKLVLVMPDTLSLAQGKQLVQLARKSIQYFLASGRRLSELCEDKRLFGERGVFVTLYSFPEKGLRGCIGFPYPVKPLWNAIAEAALEAAVHDPRFPPMQASELPKTIIEVSVLTKPEEITGERKQLPEKIEIGKDGLIVKRGYHSGLLLPQVAEEQSWNAETFLENCCLKAGLMQNMWQSKETHIFKFQAQIFSEIEPEGKVEEKE